MVKFTPTAVALGLIARVRRLELTDTTSDLSAICAMADMSTALGPEQVVIIDSNLNRCKQLANTRAKVCSRVTFAQTRALHADVHGHVDMGPGSIGYLSSELLWFRALRYYKLRGIVLIFCPSSNSLMRGPDNFDISMQSDFYVTRYFSLTA